MAEPDLKSPSALICRALSELLSSVIPGSFDFVLIVEHESKNDMAIESSGYTPDQAIELVRIAARVMNEHPGSEIP